MKIVLLGPPGCGKGTQAKLLSDKLSLPHVSTGDILRKAMEEKTKVGLEAKAFMDSGKLVPDVVIMAIIGERLSKPDVNDGFIFDGFPRTLAQAEGLQNELSSRRTGLDKVVYFDLSDEEIVSRLSGRRSCSKCGKVYHVDHSPSKVTGACDSCGGNLYQRDDDKTEIVKNRLKTYHEQTGLLIDFYAKKNVLLKVAAERPIGDVFKEVLSKLKY